MPVWLAVQEQQQQSWLQQQLMHAGCLYYPSQSHHRQETAGSLGGPAASCAAPEGQILLHPQAANPAHDSAGPASAAELL